MDCKIVISKVKLPFKIRKQIQNKKHRDKKRQAFEAMKEELERNDKELERKDKELERKDEIIE